MCEIMYRRFCNILHSGVIHYRLLTNLFRSFVLCNQCCMCKCIYYHHLCNLHRFDRDWEHIHQHLIKKSTRLLYSLPKGYCRFPSQQTEVRQSNMLCRCSLKLNWSAEKCQSCSHVIKLPLEKPSH